MTMKMLRKTALALLIAALMLALAVGCSPQSNNDPALSQSDAIEYQPVIVRPTVIEAYAVIIGEYYEALSEGQDSAQLMDRGLNYMAGDTFFGSPLDQIGYAVTDIDSDGIDELLIGTIVDDSFYGKMIFSMYTLDENGEPMLVFDGTERDRFYYVGGIKFANLGFTSWSTYVTTLKLQNREMVDMTYTTEPEDYVQMNLIPIGQWADLAPAE